MWSYSETKAVLHELYRSKSQLQEVQDKYNLLCQRVHQETVEHSKTSKFWKATQERINNAVETLKAHESNIQLHCQKSNRIDDLNQQVRIAYPFFQSISSCLVFTHVAHSFYLDNILWQKPNLGNISITESTQTNLEIKNNIRTCNIL